MNRSTNFATCLLLLIVTCIYAEDPNFGSRINNGTVAHDPISEASGLAASRQNADVLWTHNDSGGLPIIFALNEQGAHLGIYTLFGAGARDYEDIAVGPGPVSGQQYIYIGDFGDNDAVNTTNFIYRVAEPAVSSTQLPQNVTLSGVETIRYSYPDGPRDAETMMVDPITSDIYIVSKREDSVRVYRAPFPQSTSVPITLEHVATLDVSLVVGGDISADGTEIIMKTYTAAFMWCRDTSETIAATLDEPSLSVPYNIEVQGEAICWAGDNSGYFTVSEETAGIPAVLYFYPRITTGIDQPSLAETPLLLNNYPNPFNPQTTIRYSLTSTGTPELNIYDQLGRFVRQLRIATQTIGPHEIVWDGRDEAGSPVAAGIYYAVLRAGKEQRVQMMHLQK